MLVVNIDVYTGVQSLINQNVKGTHGSRTRGCKENSDVKDVHTAQARETSANDFMYRNPLGN